MFWRKVFGDVMFEKVQKYAKDKILPFQHWLDLQ